MNSPGILKYILLSCCLMLIKISLAAQPYRYVENTAFARGEKLTFRVYYQSFVTGKVTAGEARLEVKDKPVTQNGRSTYHIVGTGESKGAFNLFFKVNDRFETFIDDQALIPWYFIRRTREGGYKKDDEVTFHQNNGIAVSRNAVKKIPENAQDILSVFYYARTLDITGVQPNESFPLSFFLDDSLYVSKIVFLGREQVKTSLGTFNCLKFKPMVIKGDVFAEPYPMVLWITDDKNRLPVMVSSAVIVGSVKMELISYEGLKNTLSSLVVHGKTIGSDTTKKGNSNGKNL
ncbi:MAG: DUF3108 domain-containing protein [Lentimicrobium sp.]|nr:DUF3108 domain-containing protein [Lentimicrobium sp.]